MSPKRIERQECIIYARCVGWITPTKNYNPGKLSEWNDRKMFKINQEKL